MQTERRETGRGAVSSSSFARVSTLCLAPFALYRLPQRLKHMLEHIICHTPPLSNPHGLIESLEIPRWAWLSPFSSSAWESNENVRGESGRTFSLLFITSPRKYLTVTFACPVIG